jgi:predicted permease
LASIPGVESASIAAFVPFGFSTEARGARRTGVVASDPGKGSTAAEGREFVALWNSVGEDYFKTVGLSLLRGRAFNRAEADSPGGPRVAIIDQRLADNLWPDGDALGQRIHLGAGGDDAIEVIGIVPEVRYSFFRQLTGAIYLPFAQGFRGPVNFHIRTRADTRAAALALTSEIRKRIQRAAPGVPVFKVRTFRQHLEASADLWLVHTAAILFSLFGGLALGLAVVGLYGVKAYAVSRRTREIGIRMALGANRREVVGMILREGLVTIAIGGSLGLLLGLGLGRLCATMLYNVSPTDPLALTVAPAILSGTAIAACLLPAWRASRVNPLTALRTE